VSKLGVSGERDSVSPWRNVPSSGRRGPKAQDACPLLAKLGMDRWFMIRISS
jgi:hypothetical protein